MISFEASGSWDQSEATLRKLAKADIFNLLNKYGQMGVEALRSATPIATGWTADAWSYEIVRSSGSYSIIWNNNHIEEGVNIAVILQYGHGTGTGGYVRGRDYINPAMQPLFDRMADDAWKAVTSA